MLAYKKQLVYALIALITASVATLTVPVAIRKVIDFGFTGGNEDRINSYFLAMLGVVAILALASSARFYFVTSIGERVVTDIRKAVFKSVLDFDAHFFETARTGEIISRLTADTTQIKSAVGSTASIALRNILLFIGALTMMAVTSPKLSSLVLFIIPLIVVPVIAIGRMVRRRSKHAQAKLADASAYASEMIGSVNTIQAFTAEERINTNFSSSINEAFTASLSSAKARATLTAILIFLVFLSIVGILWLGAHDVIAGTMSPGQLSQFLLYAVFAAGSMAALSEVWGEMQQTAGATERLMELVAERPSITAPTAPQSIDSGDISFNAMSFAYGASTPTLHDITTTIKKGEVVAIVGPSGAGKTTLFTLLLRFYDPTSGTITIGDTNIRETDPNKLRGLISTVPQEPIIFGSTVAENIGFGVDNMTEEQMKAAAKAARVDTFVEKMPDGYQTHIGERGITLSGGQKQRIAIARALLKDAPILLLDEATSALDAESEAHIQEALDTLMQGRTTLIIAHRLATILKADRILVLDEGRIIEEGTHETLVQQNGLYARLARLQFNHA